MRKLQHLLIFFAFSFSAYSLQVESTYIGFNNNIYENAFNFISFTLHNDSSSPFEGTIKLRDDSIGVKTINTKDIFLTPNQRKTVQMYFFVERNYRALNLEFADRRETVKLPRNNNPANIFIGSKRNRLPKSVKSFPEENFPSSVAYTLGLNMVIMDSAPDWAPKQKLAFVNWLKLGGTLYIMKNQAGRYPHFTSQMSSLNRPNKRFSIGNGLVKKIDSFDQITFENTLKQEQLQGNSFENNEENIFANLQLLVKTDHNWNLIYFLIVVYLLLIGPANYLVAQKKRDWKLPNLFFIATVAIFSLSFSIIGKRGYGEETKLSSFTLADHISEDNFLIRQWSNIFVTSGDTYTLKHATDDSTYTSPANYEMPTKINQSTANFVADIPLFSSKRMLHMGTAKGHSFTISKLVRKKQGISLNIESSKPITKAWFVMNGTTFKANNNNGNFTPGEPVEFYQNYNTEAEKAYETIENLVLRQATLNKNSALTWRVDPFQNNQIIHFYALTETPETFHAIGAIAKNESGWTLNRFKFNLDETTLNNE